MGDLPAITPRKVIKILLTMDFVFIRQKGSHRLYRKDNRLIVVPYHNKDLKTGTLRSIIHQAGLSVEEFLRLM